MGRVSINEQVFESTVNQAVMAKSNLSAIKPMRFSPAHTNLKSMKEQLDVIQDFYETLQVYCELLDHDLNKLQTTGREMVQQDKKISQSMKITTP